MLNLLLAGLGSLSMPTILIIFGSLLIGSCTLTGFKVHEWTAASYEKQIMADKIITVVKTQEVAVLDQKSLTSALAKQKAQLERDFANLQTVQQYVETHPVTTSPECKLDADGLRLWNDENRGVEVQ